MGLLYPVLGGPIKSIFAAKCAHIYTISKFIIRIIKYGDVPRVFEPIFLDYYPEPIYYQPFSAGFSKIFL